MSRHGVTTPPRDICREERGGHKEKESKRSEINFVPLSGGWRINSFRFRGSLPVPGHSRMFVFLVVKEGREGVKSASLRDVIVKRNYLSIYNIFFFL